MFPLAFLASSPPLTDPGEALQLLERGLRQAPEAAGNQRDPDAS